MEGRNGFTSVNGGLAASPSVTPSSAGTKRKRSTNAPKFYAVRVGKEPGIYHSWSECLDQVRGYPKAAFKSFTSFTEAQNFVDGHEGSGGAGGGNGGGGKFYAVQSGRQPGVYTSWPEVLEQITGWKGPKHKVFKTKMEAEMFVAEGRKDHGPIAIPNGNGTLESIEQPESTPPKKTAKTGSKGKKGVKDESPGAGFEEGGEYEAGEGPVPPDAEDNFDPTITLDQTLGTARYKTASELSKTKYQASAPVKASPIRIYTDGSALSNGQRDSAGQSTAIGGVGVYFGPLDKRNISEPLTGTKQTNQRAELTAILRALEVAPRDRKIIIYSDSHYAIKCVTEWFLKWRSNNWLNSSHKPVENKDLILKVIDMLEERFRLNRSRMDDEADIEMDGEQHGHWDRGPSSVQFVWVKGHSKDEGNSAADELAVNGARTARELGEDVELD